MPMFIYILTNFSPNPGQRRFWRPVNEWRTRCSDSSQAGAGRPRRSQRMGMKVWAAWKGVLFGRTSIYCTHFQDSSDLRIFLYLEYQYHSISSPLICNYLSLHQVISHNHWFLHQDSPGHPGVRRRAAPSKSRRRPERCSFANRKRPRSSDPNDLVLAKGYVSNIFLPTNHGIKSWERMGLAGIKPNQQSGIYNY